MTTLRPRILAIMGSGETSPTMGKVHRELSALGSDAQGTGAGASAVMLDTPFGFQENADVITAKAQEYFVGTVGRDLAVASFRSVAQVEADPLAHEQMLATLRTAGYVFAGPGSPSYALGQWTASLVPAVLADKLKVGGTGGVVTFASAAAVTLGPVALPVYEIYKVGEPPHWLEGLDLMSEIGLRAAVVPHFNNAEGGNHDTRYCYMGERRLSMLEELLPSDVFILGVDEHTACIFDLEAGTATVSGIGRMTVRRHGEMTCFPTGATVGLDELADLGVSPLRLVSTGTSSEPVGSEVAGGRSEGPLLDHVADCESRFDDAFIDKDAPNATRTVLELEAALAAWAGDMTQSDHVERGRAALRALVVRLGQAAECGLRDPRELVSPYIEALLAARARARAGQRWEEADQLRTCLVEAGVEIHDTPAGSEWSLS